MIKGSAVGTPSDTFLDARRRRSTFKATRSRRGASKCGRFQPNTASSNPPGGGALAGLESPPTERRPKRSVSQQPFANFLRPDPRAGRRQKEVRRSPLAARRPETVELSVKFRNGILSGLLALLLVFSVFTAPLTSRAQTSGGEGSVAPGRKAEFVPGSVLVRFRTGSEMLSAASGARRAHTSLPSEDGREIAAQVEDFAGGEIVEGLRLVHVAPEETLDAVKALSARADVLYAEPDYIWHKAATPNESSSGLYGDQWGLKNTGQVGFNDFTGQQGAGLVGADIKAEQAWDLTTGSKNVVVAVIDEGIDINHPDLQSNIWTNPFEIAGNGVDDDGDGFADDVHGWDFVHNDSTVFDDTAGVYPPPQNFSGGWVGPSPHRARTLSAPANNVNGGVGVKV